MKLLVIYLIMLIMFASCYPPEKHIIKEGKQFWFTEGDPDPYPPNPYHLQDSLELEKLYKKH